MFPQPNNRRGRRHAAQFQLDRPLTLVVTNSVHATEITIWNFNDSDLAADHGTGTLTSDFNLVKHTVCGRDDK